MSVVNELELDLLRLARVAASSGAGPGRRSVMLMARKYAGTDLGAQLRSVCAENRIPLEVDRVAAADDEVESQELLRARETMDVLRVLAKGDQNRLQDFKLAMDFALGDFGARFAHGQLLLLVKKGEREAADAIAAFLATDKRKTYADAGRRFVAASEKA